MKSSMIENAVKVCQEVLKSYSNKKLQSEKNHLISCMQQASSNEEKEKYLIRLNEINMQLAKK